MDRWIIRIVSVLSIALCILAWEYTGTGTGTVPNPSDVLANLKFSCHVLQTRALDTFLIASLGLIVALAVVFIILVLCALFPWFDPILQPYLALLQVVPKVALVPLFLVVFQSNEVAMLMIASIISFFPLVVAGLAGLQSAKSEYRDMFKILNVSNLRFAKIILISSLPTVLINLRISAIYALIGTITAEFLIVESGIGYYIMQQEASLQSAGVFSGVAVAALLGALMWFAAAAIQTLFLRLMYGRRYSSIRILQSDAAAGH